MKGKFEMKPTPDGVEWDNGDFVEVLVYQIISNYGLHRYYIFQQHKYSVWRSEYRGDDLGPAGDGGEDLNENLCNLPSESHREWRLGIYDNQHKRFLKKTVPIDLKDLDQKELKEPELPMAYILDDKVPKYKKKLAEIIDEYHNLVEALEKEQQRRYRW